MPWNVEDVEKHKKGLSDEEKKKWVAIANNVLKQCQDKNGSNCDAMAIRVANSKVGESKSVIVETNHYRVAIDDLDDVDPPKEGQEAIHSPLAKAEGEPAEDPEEEAEEISETDETYQKDDESAEGKSVRLEETLVAYGDEVKSINGKIGGYLVRFSDEKNPDLAGDFFTEETDFGELKESPLYYEHGLDEEIGLKKFGKVSMKKDKVGIWVEQQIKNHDEYLKEYMDAIEQKLIPMKKLGWSSGTAAHLVRRENVGHARKILSWPLGFDASLTPTPAEPRNEVMSLKSVVAQSIKSLTTEDIQKVSEKDTSAVVEEKVEVKKEFEMDEETIKLIKETVAESVKSAMPAPEPKGAEVVKSAPVVLKEPLGDSGLKSMEAYFRSGGKKVDSNLKSEQPWVDGSELKTNTYSELTDASGLITVPPDYWNKIVEYRDESSIIRMAPASNIVNTSSNRVEVPVQGGKESKLVQTTELTGTSDQTATAPFAAVEVIIYTWTRYFPISNQLLHDNKFDVSGHIARRAGKASARTENAAILTGTGSSTVQGVLYGGTAGKTSASGGSIAAADVWGLSAALPAWYLDGACWVGRWATFNKIYQLETTAGIYGFMPIGGPGEFGKSLFGKPIFLSDEVPAIAISAKELVFGNFEFLAFAENQGFQMMMNPYDDMVHNNTNIYCVQRFGCKVAIAEAFQYLTGATA